MRKYRNRILLGLGIALAVYIVLLIVLDNQQDLSTGDVLQAMQTFPVHLLIPLALLQLSAGVFRFLEWHYYLGVIDARRKISLLDSIVLFVSGFTLVISPGKIAEVLKAVILKMKTGTPIARSTPVVLAERIVDGIAVIVIMVAAVLLAGDQLDIGNYRWLILSAGSVLAAGLIIVQIRPLVYFCLDILKHLPLIRRLHGWLFAFYESSREIFSLRHVIPTSFLGVGVYLSTVFSFVIVARGFGVEINTLSFLQIMFITGVASAVGALSLIPNGAGATEISNTVLLISLVGMPPASAAAAAIVQDFFSKWFRVLVGLGTAFVFHKRLFPQELEAELATLEHRSPQPVDNSALSTVPVE